MKKTTIIVLFLCLVFLSQHSRISAKSFEELEVQDFFESMKAVTPQWEYSKLKKGDIIYGENDCVIGTIYRPYEKQKQHGYILYINGKGIIEATWEGSDGAREINGKVYYIFPGIFVTKNKFNDLYNPIIYNDSTMVYGTVSIITTYFKMNEVINHSEIYLNFNSSKVPNLSSKVDIEGGGYTSKRTISDVPDYTWREGCSPTALANIIAYFDNETMNDLSYYDGSTNFSVLSSVTIASNNLIDELAYYLNTDDEGGSNQAEIFFGWGTYMNDNNHPEYDIYIGGFVINSIPGVPNTSDYMSLISNGNPVLIAVYNHPTYSNHALTGIGFVSNPISSGVIALDNNPNTSREIFLSYSELTDYYFIYDK